MQITTQLKKDFARQIGPKPKRRAAVQFEHWKSLGSEALAAEGRQDDVHLASVLPLALFQPDETQAPYEPS